MTVRGAALVVVLVLATVGEGGARPDAMMVWHAALFLLLALELFAPGASRPAAAIRPGVTLCATLAGAVLIAGAATAPAGYAAWLTVLEAGACAAVAVLAARRGTGFPSSAAPWLLFVAAVLGSVAVWQRLVLETDRPAATFLNTNHLGAWLVAALLLYAGVALGSERAPARRRLLVAGALLVPPAFAGLAATGSRGAVLGLAVGAAVLAAARFRHVAPAVRRGLVAALVVAVALCGAVVAGRLADDDPFRWQRVRIWRATAAVALDRPWSGTGPNQFAVAARPYQFPDDDGPLRHDRVFTTTHSDILRVAAELGVPGLVAFALLAAALVSAATRRLRDDPAAAGVVAALAALATQATVDNLSARPAVYLFAALLAGAAAVASDRRATRGSRALRGGLLALLTLCVAVGDVAPWLGWRALSGLSHGPLDAAGVARLERAAALNPWHPATALRQAEYHAGRGPLTLESYAAAREAAERARRLSPRAAEYALGVARVEAVGCLDLFRDRATRDRARAAYLAAERLQPTNPLLPLELAEFLVRAGDPVGALAAAGRAVALEPESVAPRVGLAEAEAAAGRPAQARASLAMAIRAAEVSGAFASLSPYAERLLTLDSARVAAIRSRLDARTAPAAGPVPPEHDR